MNQNEIVWENFAIRKARKVLWTYSLGPITLSIYEQTDMNASGLIASAGRRNLNLLRLPIGLFVSWWIGQGIDK